MVTNISKEHTNFIYKMNTVLASEMLVPVQVYLVILQNAVIFYRPIYSLHLFIHLRMKD